MSTAALAVTLVVATPALAQSTLEPRVDRLEREIKAVQRKVFPGGGGGIIQPDNGPTATAAAPSAGTPASGPIIDLQGRIGALETQMSGLTNQTEETQHRLRQLEDAFAGYRRATDARLKALEDRAASSASSTGSGAAIGPVDEGGGSATLPRPGPRPPRTGAGVTKPKNADAPAPAPTPTGKDLARADRLAAIERPATGDDTEDAYLYGYRLWQAKLLPEAEAQLKKVVSDYPKSRRASYAQNLLGRSYVDDGKPSLAAIAFYQNYRQMPDGERAPDSLLSLAQTLVRLKKPASDVCKVYGELTDVYGAKLSPAQHAEVDRGRAESRCK